MAAVRLGAFEQINEPRQADGHPRERRGRYVMRFAGKVAVVTGANSGIGRATALRLIDEGADVFAVDAAQTEPWPPHLVDRVHSVTVDVASPDAPGVVTG